MPKVSTTVSPFFVLPNTEKVRVKVPGTDLSV